MKIPIYQVDAFSRVAFGGNPAAVCPLESWIYDVMMQKIAAENALSETAFIVPRGDDWEIRWFTPVQEVELCGHATLASGYIALTHLQPKREIVRFAREMKPDLVIMGAHGHGGLKDLIFGNTINPVRHDLELPMLIVRPGKS